MASAEEQIIKQAAEDLGNELHVKVKLFVKARRKVMDDTVRIRQRANLHGGASPVYGFFMYNNQEEPPCSFATTPSSPYQIFAVYDEQSRRWDFRWFIKQY